MRNANGISLSIIYATTWDALDTELLNVSANNIINTYLFELSKKIMIAKQKRIQPYKL